LGPVSSTSTVSSFGWFSHPGSGSTVSIIDQRMQCYGGLMDMEGRIYDPEVGRFLSPDPNVQFPDSSQGYNRYTYCNNNPLSLSDPTGYISVGQVAGLAAAIVMTYYGDTEGWSWYATSFASGAVGGYVGSGGSFQAGLISGVEAVAFSYAGDQTSWANNDLGLLEKSATEGLIGGAFSLAGGGRFSDGFLGAFVSSEVGSTVSGIAAGNYSAAAIATRTVVSAVIGGTVSSLTGGDFSDGAVAAAMQRLYNEEEAKDPAEEQSEEQKENAEIADAAAAASPVYRELVRQLKMYDEDFDPSGYGDADSLRYALKDYVRNGFCGPFGEVNENDVNHIFASKHMLGDFELKFSSRAAAFEAVWGEAQGAVNAGRLKPGIFEDEFTVQGTKLFVQGRVFENGTVRVGDFWIPK
jgi:RHS repeat-associated protein